MSQYIHLVGAEQVQSAANRMAAAAETFSRSADQIDDTLHMALNRFEELVARLEAITERSNKAP